MAVSRNEKTIAGPAPGRAASPTIAVPVVAKMPAPIVAPTPSAVRCHLPRDLLSPPACDISRSASATDFRAKMDFGAMREVCGECGTSDRGFRPDAHSVERAVHKEQRGGQEHRCEDVA